MINAIIKALGGTTETEKNEMEEVIESQKETIRQLKMNMYAVGDVVYITDPKFHPNRQYYLLESYNNLHHWFVSENPKSEQRRELINGVRFDCLSYEPPKKCNSCGHILA